MRHAGVVPRERGPELRALAVVVCGQRSLEVLSRGGELRPVEHRDAGHEQRFHQDAGIGQAVGELHTLVGQVHALSDVAAHQTPFPRAQHGSEQLRRLSGPFAQLAGTFQDGSDLGCGVPADGDVAGRQGAQELQLLASRSGDSASAPTSVRPFVRWPIASTSADRSRDRSPAFSQYAARLLGQTRLTEVMGEQLRLRLGGLRELRFQHVGDPPMELLALSLDQRVVQGVLEQRVLEDVTAAGRPALRVQDLRLHQLRQFALQRRLVQVRDGGQYLVTEFAAQRSGELCKLPLALDPIQPGHHQILKGGGNLVCQQRLAA